MKCTKGFTLIEILIALCIFSIGMLAVANLQINALRFTSQAKASTIAIIQLHNIFERLQANPQQQATEINLWNQNNQMLLPEGKGEVLNQFPGYDVRINWRGANGRDNNVSTMN